MARRFATALIAGYAAIAAAGVGLFIQLAHEQDRRAADDAVQLLVSGVASIERRLEILVYDYSVWTALYDAAVADDRPWIYENAGVTADVNDTLDLLVVAWPDGRDFGWASGGGVEARSGLLSDDALDAAIAGVADASVHSEATSSVYARSDGALWLLSATRLVPWNGGVLLPPDADDARVPRNVFGRRVDAALLRPLTQTLNLGPIAVVDAPQPGQVVTPLRGVDGRPLAYVSVAAPTPGADVLNAKLGPIVAALALVGGLVLAAARFHIASAGRLDAARAENAVAAERLRVAIAGGETGVFDMDVATGAVAYFGTQRLLRLPPDHPGPGVDAFMAMVDPGDAPRLSDAVARALDGRDPALDCNFHIIVADGAVRFWRVQATVLRDEAGAPVRLVGLNTDLTDLVATRESLARKEAEAAALERSVAQQKELAALQRQFVAMVSHEFRTPLAIIDGAAFQLNRRAARALAPEAASYFATRAATVRRNVSRLVELVETVLTTSKLEDGSVEFRPAWTDLDVMIAELASNYRDLHPDRRIECDVEASAANAVCDRVLMRQILSNLISNAAKYTDPGGEITVSARRDAATGALRLAVADTGVGIPEDEVDKLTTRFFRASTAKGRPGTGIGLHLVARFATMHGGRIEIGSRLGQGSTFTVVIPGDIAPETATTETAAA